MERVEARKGSTLSVRVKVLHNSTYLFLAGKNGPKKSSTVFWGQKNSSTVTAWTLASPNHHGQNSTQNVAKRLCHCESTNNKTPVGIFYPILCLCCHCLESASEQGGGVGLMVREVRTAPTFSAPRRRRMSGGRHSVLMCVNAHRCASNATRSPNAHIMFAWMASAWSCFDVWTIS